MDRNQDFSLMIDPIQRNFRIEVASSIELRNEAFRLRHKVYCEERHFEPGQDGLEFDEFDKMSRHVLLRHIATRDVVGTVRLVAPKLAGPGASLPMEQVSDFPVTRQLPRDSIAEVSRFALSKSWRAANGWPCGLLRLALIRGIVQLSDELNVTYWCALMEPKLLRLLQTSSIYFHPAGAMVEHHGWRQPAFVALHEMLDRVRRGKSEIWDFITDGGRSGPALALENAA